LSWLLPGVFTIQNKQIRSVEVNINSPQKASDRPFPHQTWFAAFTQPKNHYKENGSHLDQLQGESMIMKIIGHY
jgi:hypothetical protein